MSHVLPKLFRSKYSNNAVLEVHPDIINYSAGFYIQKGSMKGVVEYDDQVSEINFPEKSLILDEGYVLYPSDEIIPWDLNYHNYMIINGWKLVAQEEDTVSICLVYNIDNNDEIINVMKNNGIVYKKVDKADDSIGLYSVKTIENEMDVFLPQNHFICIAKGKVLINDVEKKQRNWVRSTKDQTFKIVNQSNEESIIFLCKIK